MKPAWVNPRCGKVYHFRRLSFYACEGLIAMHDARDDSYIVITPDDFKARVAALYRYAKKMRGSQRGHERDEWRAFVKLRDDALNAIMEAKHMGDPSDPEVAEYIRRHLASRRSSASMASRNHLVDVHGYPLLSSSPVPGTKLPQYVVGRDIAPVPMDRQAPADRKIIVSE